MENCQRHHNFGGMSMPLPRIRQLVFASNDASDISLLQDVLGLGDGYVDPGVGEFGLTNGVFSLGDQFLEVVVPVETGTAAGRFMDRTGGLGGYMAIFQTDDLDQVRHRADALKIRRVWNIDLPEISASHLHPADIGAAIVSIDEARPASAWRWGGPNWRETSRHGRLVGLTIIARAPENLSQAWGEVLGVTPRAQGHDIWDIELDQGTVRVMPGDRDYLSLYELEHPDPLACLARAQAHGLKCRSDAFTFAGVTVLLKPIDPDA